MYLFSFSNLNSYRYYEAFFNYLTLGWVFYSFVCVSTALLYKNRAVVPVKPNKKQGMIVGSEASHYCRYCGAEIKEGETTCLNCDSSLTET